MTSNACDLTLVSSSFPIELITQRFQNGPSKHNRVNPWLMQVGHEDLMSSTSLLASFDFIIRLSMECRCPVTVIGCTYDPICICHHPSSWYSWVSKRGWQKWPVPVCPTCGSGPCIQLPAPTHCRPISLVMTVSLFAYSCDPLKKLTLTLFDASR